MLARSLARALLHKSHTQLVTGKGGVGLGGASGVVHARRSSSGGGSSSSSSSSTNDRTTPTTSSSSRSSRSSSRSSSSADQPAEPTAAAGPNASRRRSRKKTPLAAHATSLVQAPAAAGTTVNTLEAGSHTQTSENHSSLAADVESAQDPSMAQPLPAAVPAAADNGSSGACAASTTPAAAAAAVPSLCELVPVPSQQALSFPDSSFRLRDYQQEAIQEVVKQWKAGSSMQLIMLPTGTGKTVVFAALARYLSQHYVPYAAVDASKANQGMTEQGVTQVAAAVAAVAAQEQARIPSAALTPAAGLAEEAQQHVAAYAGSQSATDTEAAAAAAAAVDVGSSTDAQAYTRLVSFSALRRRRGNKEQQQQQQQQQGETANAAKVTVLKPDNSSSASQSSASGSNGSSSSSISSLGAGSAGSSNEAGLASSSIDDSSSSSSSKRGRSPRVVRTCAPDLMRVLVLAHRFELLHQAEEKFNLMWPECIVSWVKGYRKDFFGQVVVASVGTAVNCIPQLAQCNFSLVVVDEAHHSVANTYKTVLRGLGFVDEVAVASSSSSSMSEAGDAAVQVEENGVDVATVATAEVGQVLSEKRREWKKRYAESGAEPDDYVVGLQALPYADAVDSSNSSTEAESTEDWDAAAAGIDGGRSSSSGRGGGSGSVQLAMRAVSNPHRLCVGFTATPYRMREPESCELYEIFANVFSRNISDMIKAHHLTKIHSRRIFTHVHLKGAGSYNGDFIVSKLSPLVNSYGRNNLVLAAFLDYCCKPDDVTDDSKTAAAGQEPGVLTAAAQAAQLANSSTSSSSSSMLSGQQQQQDDGEEVEPAMRLSMDGKRAVRKAIGFAVDIEHAEALNALFLEAGVRSGVVHSKRSIEEVNLDISRFRRGDLDVLWNCEKLTEGFDEPSINALLLARPTKSTGLYTQMLGRGLRRAPGKDSCLVLDFTDKQHKVDRIIDLRVLLPEDAFKALDRDWEPPEQKDKARKLKLDELRGGEISVLADDVDPYDMAFVRIGEHWSLSMFESGVVWLVNIAGMSAQQRQQLGLQQDNHADGDTEQQASTEDAALPVTAPSARSSSAAADANDSEDDEDAAYKHEDRFVVLHQPSQNYNPFTWRNVAPSARHGITESDAYGKAVDYMQSLVRQQQAQAVRNPVPCWKRYGGGKGKPAYFPKVETYFKNAHWRTQPASDSQLKMLTRLGVQLPPNAAAGSLSRGQASDMISQAKGALASQQQLQQLQVKLTTQELAELPVPLLAEHAAALGAPRTAASSSSSSQEPHAEEAGEAFHQALQVPAAAAQLGVQAAVQPAATTDGVVRVRPRRPQRRAALVPPYRVPVNRGCQPANVSESQDA